MLRTRFALERGGQSGTDRGGKKPKGTTADLANVALVSARLLSRRALPEMDLSTAKGRDPVGQKQVSPPDLKKGGEKGQRTETQVAERRTESKINGMANA